MMLKAFNITTEPIPYRVRIYVVPSTGYLQQMMPHPNSEVAGFYEPIASGPVVFTPENADSGSGVFNSQVVLFHEYSHHFMLQNFPVAYPAWYVEGRAETFATASFEKPGFITYGKPANYRLGEIYNLDQPASDIITKHTGEGKRVEFSYGLNWLLTHYLLFSPERKGQLSAYLAAINQGKTLEEAAKAFGDLRKLDQDFARYKEAGNFPYVAVPIDKANSEGITIRTLSPDEDAMLPLEMEYTKSDELRQGDAAVFGPYAKAFAEKVEQAAAPYPQSKAALFLIALSEKDADHLDVALQAADRLIAIAPDFPRGHVVKGQILLAKAEKASGADKTALAAAGRKEFVAANKLNADDPLPLIGFYMSYGAGGVGSPDIAIQGLVHAVAIVPQDGDTRMMLARAYIVRGDKQNAIATLKPMTANTHGGRSAQMATKMIARLEGREEGDPLKVEIPKDPKTPAPPKKT